MRCRGWCGECYSGLKGRAAYKGHCGYQAKPPETRGEWIMFLKRASGTGKPGSPGAVLVDPSFLEYHPALHEFFSLTQWDEKTKRKPGTMSLFVEDGRWKSFVNDKDANRFACISAGTFEELLETLERLLREDELEWRQNKGNYRK